MGAGACIALTAGSGLAQADTEAAASSSSAAGSDSSVTDRSEPTSRDNNNKNDNNNDDDNNDGTHDSADHESSPSRADDNANVTQRHRSADDEPTRTDRRRTLVADDDNAENRSSPADGAESGAEQESVNYVRTERATHRLRTPVQPTQPEAPAATAPAPSPGPLATGVLNLLSGLGWSPHPEALAAPPAPAPATVSGVRTGHSSLTIPLGDNGFTTAADWYFPTQADGSVAATGVIWLQHSFLGDKSWYSALAKSLSQQTNSVVVAPNVPSFPFGCAGCSLNDSDMQQAVATMFDGSQEALNTSAIAAGYQGTLPEQFILAGHSAGGGFAAAVGGFYATNPNQRRLRGVVMFDGVSRDLDNALDGLGDIPVYQIAAPPQAWNAFGATTHALVAARPGQFVGVTLANGSHADALIGGNLIVDFFAQLFTRFSPPGNTAAVYTLANGWISDLYQGLGPSDGTGIYGEPDQYLVLGDAAGVVLAPAPAVDLNRYLGTWYEVGSVKQFFSLGLVNTTAVYSLNPDGSVRVENSGNYFVNNGPQSRIVGVALPVDATNNKLNVTFFGPASDNPPGNYWIVDLDPDYQWAIVSDPTGFSGFLLSRSQVVSDELYQELLNRASVQGIWGWITRTRQPAAEAPAAVSV